MRKALAVLTPQQLATLDEHKTVDDFYEALHRMVSNTETLPDAPATDNVINTFTRRYLDIVRDEPVRRTHRATRGLPKVEHDMLEAERPPKIPVASLNGLLEERHAIQNAWIVAKIEQESGLRMADKSWQDSIFGWLNNVAMPDYKYCGAGTDIVAHMLNDVTPINELDAMCRAHDVAYMVGASKIASKAVPDGSGEGYRDIADKKLLAGVQALSLQNIKNDVSDWALKMVYDGITTARKTPMDFVGTGVPLSKAEKLERSARVSGYEKTLKGLNNHIRNRATPEELGRVVAQTVLQDGKPVASAEEFMKISDLIGAPIGYVRQQLGESPPLAPTLLGDKFIETLKKTVAQDIPEKRVVDTPLPKAEEQPPAMPPKKQAGLIEGARGTIAEGGRPLETPASATYGVVRPKSDHALLLKELREAYVNTPAEIRGDPHAIAEYLHGIFPNLDADTAEAVIGAGSATIDGLIGSLAQLIEYEHKHSGEDEAKMEHTPVLTKEDEALVIEPIFKSARQWDRERLRATESQTMAESVAVAQAGGVAPVGSSAIGGSTVESGKLPNPVMAQIAPPIIGERNARSTLIIEGPDAVKLTEHQKEMSRRWYSNFMWVDEGYGNGNIERLPWDEKSGEYRNSLYRASKVNENIRYSGALFDGGQTMTPVPQQSKDSHYRHQVPMIPDVQNRQAFQRANELPARAGRSIEMIRDNPNAHMLRKTQVFAKDMRLYHPNVVADSRGVTRV